MMISKVITAIYICILLLIIYLANTEILDNYISFYHRIPLGDALGHFVLMGTLSFFANYLLEIKVVSVCRYKCQLGSLLVMFFVIIEECSQVFIPNRTFSLLDLYSDLFGICLFGLLAKKVYEFKKGNSENDSINFSHN